MAGIKIVGVNEIQKGSYMLFDGIPCKVTEVSISKPGKHGHAKFRIIGVGLLDEKKREVVMPHRDVEVPIVEKRNAQILSVNGNMANVMDGETFEVFDIEIPEELKAECLPGMVALYWDIMNTRTMKQVKPAE